MGLITIRVKGKLIENPGEENKISSLVALENNCESEWSAAIETSGPGCWVEFDISGNVNVSKIGVPGPFNTSGEQITGNTGYLIEILGYKSPNEYQNQIQSYCNVTVKDVQNGTTLDQANFERYHTMSTC